MNREKAYKLLGIFGDGHIGKTKKGTTLVFARQSKKDIEGIEKYKDDDLIDEWKGLTYMNYIYSQVSLNEMQRISLLELEMDDRDNINEEELRAWYKEAEAKEDVRMKNEELLELLNLKELNNKETKITEELRQQADNNDLNNCDKCGIWESTYTLIWIDAEDFEPLTKDNFDETKYKNALKKYSALCVDCYKKECCEVEDENR